MSLVGPPNRGWTHIPYLFGELGADFRPSGSHGSGQVVHFHSFGINSHLGKKRFNIGDAFCGICISLQEMTLSLESTRHKNAVNAPFKGPKHVKMVQFSGAGESNNFYVGWITEPHDPRQIRGGKRAIVTGKGQHIRLPFFGYFMGLFQSRSRFSGSPVRMVQP